MITLLLLVCTTYMYGAVLHAHPVRGESHNQRNTTGEVATITTACCRSKHEVFKPLCEIGVKRNFSLEKSLITRHLRVRRIVFQVTHFATGDCLMKYQICWELMFRVMVRIYGLPSGFRVEWCEWVIELCSVRLIDGMTSNNAFAFN